MPGYTTTASYTKAPIGSLVADDFAWNRGTLVCICFLDCLPDLKFIIFPGYKWYPDTPGAYPASKTDWYWKDGGLYDQVSMNSYIYAYCIT